MQQRRAEIGRPLRCRQLGGQPFELATPDVLQIAACRGRGGLLVQEYGQVEAFGDGGGSLARQRDAIGHRRPLERHERHDVDRTESRVLSLMPPQIDPGEGGLEERDHRRRQRVAIAGKGQDGAVVRGIRLQVEEADAGNRAHRGADGLDRRGVPAFADVRDALDDGHAVGVVPHPGAGSCKCYTARDLRV